MIELSGKITQADFGRMVGISQPAVSDLLTRNVLDRDGVAGDWLIAYCGHLREVAAGRASDGDLDLVQERAALAREQRERIAMQNAVTRRELAPVVLIEEVLAKAGAKVAGILDSIPGAIRRRVPSLPAEALSHIASEIARVRNIAAAVSLADLVDDAEQTADESDSPVEELEA